MDVVTPIWPELCEVKSALVFDPSGVDDCEPAQLMPDAAEDDSG